MFKKKEPVRTKRYTSSYEGLASRRLANVMRAAIDLNPRTFRYPRDHFLASDAYRHMTIIPTPDFQGTEASVDIYIDHVKHWTICTDANFDFVAVRSHIEGRHCHEYTTLTELLAEFNNMFRAAANNNKASHETDVEVSPMMSSRYDHMTAKHAAAA